jgi:hypothetical protein
MSIVSLVIAPTLASMSGHEHGHSKAAPQVKEIKVAVPKPKAEKAMVVANF